MIQVAQSRLLPHLTLPVREKRWGTTPRGRRSTHRDPKISVGQAQFQFLFPFALGFKVYTVDPRKLEPSREIGKSSTYQEFEANN